MVHWIYTCCALGAASLGVNTANYTRFSRLAAPDDAAAKMSILILLLRPPREAAPSAQHMYIPRAGLSNVQCAGAHEALHVGDPTTRQDVKIAMLKFVTEVWLKCIEITTQRYQLLR